MLNKILATLLLVGGITLAQGPPPRQEYRPLSAPDYKPQNMDAVRIWRLTEVLELTEDQTVTFLPMIQIQERKLRQVQQEMEQLSKQGRKLLDKDNISQKNVDKLIKQYAQKQDEMHRIKREFIQSLPKYLSPKQLY